jgi:twitching motility two-component system response regulator PilH
MSIERVLVVDDSPTDLHLITGYLRKHGYQALAATNGADAISTAKSERPDLILMDIVMPEMNGFEATRTLSRDPDTAQIPVVMVSSKSQETDKIWSMRQGAADYLVKPVTENMLIKKIKML